MKFEDALKLLKAGYPVRLPDWHSSIFLMIYDNKVQLMVNGFEPSRWHDCCFEILSNEWECHDGLIFYDQGCKDGYE